MPASYTSYMVIPETDHSALAQFGKTSTSCRVAGCSKRKSVCKHNKAGKGRVSLAQAEQVLAAVREQWKAEQGWYHEDMFLTSHEHEELEDGSWGLAWEGGPEDWSWSVEHKVPGVFVEAQYSWLVAVHPS